MGTARFDDGRLVRGQVEPAQASIGVSSRVLLFDACHVGVVLRLVVAVEVAIAIAAAFVPGGLSDWFTRVSVWSAGALPASLLWLVVACALKQVLMQLPVWLQYALGVVLGMLAAEFAVQGLYMLGMLDNAPTLAGAATGALVSMALMSDLHMRARMRAPAAADARLAELQARIRPHFLFNALNTAIALVREAPADAERVLEDLAELFRHALTDVGESASLADELMLARRYLDIEQLRFGDRLQLHWQVDEAVGQARLPPLVLQPLVENTIRHGVEPSPTGAHVWVGAQRRGDTVEIRVRNTLPAGAGHAGQGMALANVRERLNLLHDVQSSFRAGLIAHGLYEVRIRIPLKAEAVPWHRLQSHQSEEHSA